MLDFFFHLITFTKKVKHNASGKTTIEIMYYFVFTKVFNCHLGRFKSTQALFHSYMFFLTF